MSALVFANGHGDGGGPVGEGFPAADPLPIMLQDKHACRFVDHFHSNSPALGFIDENLRVNVHGLGPPV